MVRRRNRLFDRFSYPLKARAAEGVGPYGCSGNRRSLLFEQPLPVGGSSGHASQEAGGRFEDSSAALLTWPSRFRMIGLTNESKVDDLPFCRRHRTCPCAACPKCARAVPPSLREAARVQRVTEGVAIEQSAAYRKSVDRTSKASTAAVHAVLPQALRASSLPEGAKGLRRS